MNANIEDDDHSATKKQHYSVIDCVKTTWAEPVAFNAPYAYCRDTTPQCVITVGRARALLALLDLCNIMHNIICQSNRYSDMQRGEMATLTLFKWIMALV